MKFSGLLKKYIFGVQKRLYGLRRSLSIYNKREKKTLSLSGKGTGDACFIIGNGPSLTVSDIESINRCGFTTFASNKIYKMFPMTQWRPDYYACVDENVFYQNYEDILSNIGCPKLLNHRFLPFLQAKDGNLEADDIYYTTYSPKRGRVRFYPQAANVLSGGTVTFTLMEFAWMLGYRTFYIIGCDHNYVAFENLKDKNSEFIQCDTHSNRDYFVKDYVKPGETMRVGDLGKAERGYEAARIFIESNGGKVYNATRGGKLEVFERIDVDDLFQNNMKVGQ